MFLLAITTLIISLIGLYTQVLSAEAARLAAKQNAYGQTMINWHDAAVSMAASILDSNSYTYYNLSPKVCALDGNTNTSGDFTTAVAECPMPSNPICQKGSTCTTPAPITSLCGTTGIVYSKDGTTKCQLYNVKTSTVEDAHLPQDYKAKTYQYNSILYNVAGGSGNGTNYVLTYIKRPPAAALGAVTTVNGTNFNINAGDMMRQVKLAGHGVYMYGYITNTAAGTVPVMHTQYTVGSATSPMITFNLPDALKCVAVPCPLDGAIALVSSPDGL